MSALPAPFTPSDCDLNGFKFMPLDVIRLVDSDLAALSTGDEFKAAVILWCKSWTQIPAASLPNDDRVLARLAGLGLGEWKSLREGALRGFELCSDGRFYHPVVAEKALEAWTHRQNQRARATSRWQKEREKQGKNAEVMPRHKPGNAMALPADMQGTGTGTGNNNTPSESSANADKPAGKSKPNKRASGCDQFDSAWAAWPQRGRSSKSKALKLWTAHAADPKAKREAVARFLRSKDATKDGGAYVQGFERWLRDRLESWLETAPAEAPRVVRLPDGPPWWRDAAAIIAATDAAAWASYGHAFTPHEDADGMREIVTASRTAHERMARIVDALEDEFGFPIIARLGGEGPSR